MERFLVKTHKLLSFDSFQAVSYVKKFSSEVLICTGPINLLSLICIFQVYSVSQRFWKKFDHHSRKTNPSFRSQSLQRIQFPNHLFLQERYRQLVTNVTNAVKTNNLLQKFAKFFFFLNRITRNCYAWYQLEETSLQVLFTLCFLTEKVMLIVVNAC